MVLFEVERHILSINFSNQFNSNLTKAIDFSSFSKQ